MAQLFASVEKHWQETATAANAALEKVAAHEGSSTAMTAFVSDLLRTCNDVLIPKALHMLQSLRGQIGHRPDSSIRSELQRQLEKSKTVRAHLDNALRLMD